MRCGRPCRRLSDLRVCGPCLSAYRGYSSPLAARHSFASEGATTTAGMGLGESPRSPTRQMLGGLWYLPRAEQQQTRRDAAAKLSLCVFWAYSTSLWISLHYGKQEEGKTLDVYFQSRKMGAVLYLYLVVEYLEIWRPRAYFHSQHSSSAADMSSSAAS